LGKQAVWIKGPIPASNHDVSVFRSDLKQKIADGKKGIADNGYRGERNVLSKPNSHDPPELRQFKRRAWSRHETYNGRIKNFRCLDSRFRHGIAKHQMCFETVCVICQYQIENGSPLFDV